MPTRDLDPTLPRLLRGWPEPLSALCQQLEQAGVPAYVQGEALLDAWLGCERERPPSLALVCGASAARILEVLPTAVVTADSMRRLTRASAAGPVDLVPTRAQPVEAVFAAFGLAPLAVGFRPARGEWLDPCGVRERLAKHELPPLADQAEAFARAPRRYWLIAQCIAEYALEPTPELVAAALAALPGVGAKLPEGAPARRVLERILASAAPSRALEFLHASGVFERVLPGSSLANARRIDSLPPIPALRFAALFAGGAAAGALARLRMPHALARRVSRLLEAHPLDRAVESAREAQVRRLRSRLGDDELDGLIAWRRSELASERPLDRAGERGAGAPGASMMSYEILRSRDRLDKLEAVLARVREQSATSGTLKRLALDGADVMRLLGDGPGPHVGRALARLARLVAEQPEQNTREALEAALLAFRTDVADRVG